MDPIQLMEDIQTSYQQAADILGINFQEADSEEQALIIEISPIKKHHKEWYAGITKWNWRYV